MKSKNQIPATKTEAETAAPSEDDLGALYYDWGSLGCGFVSTPRQDTVDPENAIIRTTLLGRYSPRVLWGGVTWIRDNGDLVNPRKLEHMIPQGDSAVLGAMIDIALQNGADRSLKNVLPRCTGKKKKELLFLNLKGNAYFNMISVEDALPVWQAWGLYCHEIDFLKMMLDREAVLRYNKLLAIRAFLGPNVRSEIMYYLYKNARSYANELCRKIGFTYPTVYIESQRMARNGFLTTERIGNTILLRLAPRGQKLLAAI